MNQSQSRSLFCEGHVGRSIVGKYYVHHYLTAYLFLYSPLYDYSNKSQ